MQRRKAKLPNAVIRHKGLAGRWSYLQYLGWSYLQYVDWSYLQCTGCVAAQLFEIVWRRHRSGLVRDLDFGPGVVAEWLKAAVLKTAKGETPS